MIKALKSAINIEAIRRSFSSVVWLLALIIALANILTEGAIPISRETLYVVEIALCVVCLILWPKALFNTTLMLFIAVLALSNVVNNPAPQFRSWERLAFFIMMLALLSPLVGNEGLKKVRRNLWKWFIVIIKIEVILEFVLYIPWIIENHDNNIGYPGLFCHHMLHAIIASIATAVFLWELTTGKCRNRIIGTILLLMSIVVLAASGSRCAIMGFMAAAVPMIWSIRKHRKTFVAVCASAVVIIVAIIAIPSPLTKTLRFKFNIAEKHNSLTFSRDELWQARMNEFVENPFLGVGLCVSTHHSERFDKPKDDGSYISEPGSSWLSLLSNCGIFGFVIFVWFNISLLRRIFRNLNNSAATAEIRQRSLLYFCLWLLLIVHGFFEGWILYAGSLVFVFYWLLTSQITNLPNANPNIPDTEIS